MIIDAALELGTQTVAVTTSEATDDYIDFDQVNPDKGTYTVNAELIFTITTTGTGASGFFAFSLEGDSASSFASPVTLASTGAIAAESVTKNTKYRLKLPAKHEGFLRGYVTLSGAGAGAMTYHAAIVHLV